MKISNVNNFNSFGMKYRIINFPNVNSDFVNNIKTSLDSLPDSWQNPLEKDNYYLFCTNSIQDTFDAMNIPEKAPDLEAITCTAPHTKFFVFTPQIDKRYLQQAVNHEISHGIVDIGRLSNNYIILKALNKDISRFKYGKPNPQEPYNLKNLLLQPFDNYRTHEVFADIIAWCQKGGGLWGSGFKNTHKNPDFLKENFPNTFKELQNYEPSVVTADTEIIPF